MIRIEFLTPPEGGLLGFSIRGHAGLGEEGSDILCAAVSSAAYLVANTATEVLHICPLSLRAGEGEMFFRVEARDEPACCVLLQGLKLHLTGLEEQYPDHMKVGYLEV